jgi:hypothetical protein
MMANTPTKKMQGLQDEVPIVIRSSIIDQCSSYSKHEIGAFGAVIFCREKHDTNYAEQK